jgi:hypothetical protein
VDRGPHRTVEEHRATVHDTQKAAGHGLKVVRRARSFNRSPGWTDGRPHAGVPSAAAARRHASERKHITIIRSP